MAADLDFGSVPQSYLEIYDILCPGDDISSLDRDTFFSLLLCPSGLTRQNLAQIWEISDSTCQGNIKRTGIFKALALVAFAQQGKQISDKLILKFSDEELPSPDLGDFQQLKANFLRIKMQKTNETFLLADVLALDTVQVTLVPEKKGLFLKHVEYEVTSERYKAVVQRRYNDFVAFYELLLQRFPFRLIPQLPPKKMMGANAEFIEERRKSLKRFLNLVARHPTLSEDRAVQFFLTFVGTDIQHKIKDYIRNIPEELETNPMDNIQDGGQVKLHLSREQMRQVHNILQNIRTAAKRLSEKAEENGQDVLVIGRELNVMSRSINASDSLLSLDFGSMCNTSKELALLYPHLTLISQASSQQAQMEDEEVVEKLDILLDLLTAYKELGERFDVENNQEPPNLNRPRLMSARKFTSASPPSSPGAFADESKSPALASWESRKTLALNNLLSETKLIQTYLGMLPLVLHSLVTIRTKWMRKLSTIWDQMTPMVEAMKGTLVINSSVKTNSTLHSPDSPAR